MNEGEQIVREVYEGYGFTVVHTGAPDFLCFRRDKNVVVSNSFLGCHEDGAMKDVVFVEVKTGFNQMRLDQMLWRESLERLGYHYRQEYPQTIKQDHATLLESRRCECGKHTLYDFDKPTADALMSQLDRSRPALG